MLRTQRNKTSSQRKNNKNFRKTNRCNIYEKEINNRWCKKIIKVTTNWVVRNINRFDEESSKLKK